MNDLFSNKQTGYLVISALIAVMLGANYYFLVYPMSEEKNSKEVTISTVRNEIALLDSQLTAPVEEGEDKKTFQLEKKVPLTRDLDMLIKSIEEVDLVSEAKIESIEFNNYDESVADSPLVPTEEAFPEANDVTTEETEGELPAETPVSPVANSTLPPQLKLITFNINILTKDYDHLNTFIKELESIERIKRIDQIEFLLPGEESLLELDYKEAISARIQVTTFYYDE